MNKKLRNTFRPARRLLSSLLALALTAGIVTVTALPANAVTPITGPRAFSEVASGIYRGDMVMATNSNLTVGAKSASYYVPGYVAPAKLPEDQTTDDLCSWSYDYYATPAMIDAVKKACNNSSAAYLDIPRGAKIVKARLYVMNTLTEKRPETQVKLAAPDQPGTYTIMGPDTPGSPKLFESSTGKENYAQAIMRQSVWDVTSMVQQKGAGEYKVADIPSEPFSTWTPWADWNISVLYEWDPNTGGGLFIA